MCLLAVLYRSVPDAPILVAENREEFYERPSQGPSIQAGKPRTLCGTDLQAGGTWIGVNQHGLVVAVCNRRRSIPMLPSRSRGVLCREMLKMDSARRSRDLAMDELSTGKYDGANFVCLDPKSGWVVHGGDELEAVELAPGLHILAGGDVDDPRDPRVELCRRLLTLQTLDSSVTFLALASKYFARPPSAPGRPSMILRDSDRGTVSSTLISLGKKPRDAIYQYASGPPDRAPYQDYSPFLRDILSRGLREARTRAKT